MDHVVELTEFIAEVSRDRGFTYKDRVILLGDFNVDVYKYERKRSV